MFDRVLVANRGEIAVRVMAACEELGVETVAIYSDADANAGHVRYADDAYNVGPARAAESYLDQAAVLDAAREAGADAVHPGYGFLAENAEFAARVEDADGITWIGPSSEAMERLGKKTSARSVMAEAGVPIVPGTTDPVENPDEVTVFAEEHGFPVAIKAEGGGGGRGMKVVHEGDDPADALESAKREGEAYFDNANVYLERYLEAPKHVEVQVLADEHGNVRHLGERDCSLQRRHQKVVEEAPSPALDAPLREEMGEAARAGVAAADYTNAGTVEFLVADGEFYFMEVNTRIQVEHTVTEEVTGIDVVRRQLEIAAGEEIDFPQEAVEIDGHAVEFRINAENPAREFAPTPGPLERYDPPGGIGVRIDDAVREGDEIGGDYDSLIAKLIVRDEDRETCLARSRRALGTFDVAGLHTTIPFHRAMLADDRFREGSHTTDYLDEELDLAVLESAVDRWGPGKVAAGSSGGAEPQEFAVEVDGRRRTVRLLDPPGSVASAAAGDSDEGGSEPAEVATLQEPATASAAGETAVTADMQGTILEVEVAEGQEVDAGDRLCVLEAMKMENDVPAPAGGTVAEVCVSAGESVDAGDTLIVIE